MTVRSIQDHVSSLVSRRVAEAKVAGAQSPDLEARSILESIALALLLNPKAVFYFANLSRNSLRNLLSQEIAVIDSLTKTVDDLANQNFSTADSTDLTKARIALLQIEGLDKVDVSSNDYSRFSNAIDSFLNGPISKNVRRKDSTQLLRASSEAFQDLPSEFAALVDLHSEVASRLLSLSVGVENFVTSPLSTILGLSTIYRARTDIEDIIDIIDAGDSDNQARDIVVRLIGNRASIKSIGTLPTLDSPLISTGSIPAGSTIRAASPLTPAVRTSLIGPFVFAPSATASITVNGQTTALTHFPQTAVHLDNRAFVSSQAVTYPVTLSGFLFVHLKRATSSAGYTALPDGTYLKQVKVTFTGGAITLAQVLINLNSALGSDATAYEYVASGTNRIIIVGNSAITSILISPVHSEPAVDPNDRVVSANSSHALLGFAVGDQGEQGSTPVGIVVDALNIRIPTIAATRTEDDRVVVTSDATTIGTTMTIAMDSSTGLTGTTQAQSSELRLLGTVKGSSVDPIDPTPILDIGDTVTTPSGSRTVTSLTTTAIGLSSVVVTFDGSITALSALALAGRALDESVQEFMPTWFKSDYAESLETLDRALTVVSARPTAAARNSVKNKLLELKSLLQSLESSISVGVVPSNIGTQERTIVDGIISTLSERKYDRALDLLLRLQIQDFFELTGETASFGGAVMKSMSDFATTDIQFPNTQADEDSGLRGLVEEPET